MEKQFNKLELREIENGSLSIVCRVNNYGLSKELRGRNGKFREQIPRDVFQKALEANPDVKFYYNHKPYFELAEKIELRAEEDGVYLYATLKESEKGLYEAIKDGAIQGMSFGFRALKDKFESVGNFVKRTILDMELFEVSILDKEPAYMGTMAEVRELDIPVNMDLLHKRLKLYKLM
ncbi:HK97 family phage prohead protease [Clostridium sp.]|uniref:HK97 family phage prohead protease n=1 Tax=Clostridium sp. TaxID=1506 RepID=UPI0025BAB3D2|nr:HK97 family phage prohead protease [Clostridium sp.]